jgi:hypothetical protein
MIVYIITNLVNNKKYIGRDMYNNPKYLGSGKLIKLAIEKYGRDMFIKETLQSCNSIDELKDAELYWIRHYNACTDNMFYNILDGSVGGDTLTNNPNLEIIKEKIRIARKSQVIKHSEDTKAKISAAQKGEKSYWHGKQKSAESNKLRSEAAKGIPKEKIVCPHCGKEGSIAGIKRWHLDKCTVITGIQHTATNKIPWNKGKSKNELPQLSNSGAKKGNIPWNKNKKLYEDRN